jgi:hypothetical protein
MPSPPKAEPVCEGKTWRENGRAWAQCRHLSRARISPPPRTVSKNTDRMRGPSVSAARYTRAPVRLHRTKSLKFPFYRPLTFDLDQASNEPGRAILLCCKRLAVKGRARLERAGKSARVEIVNVPGPHRAVQGREPARRSSRGIIHRLSGARANRWR